MHIESFLRITGLTGLFVSLSIFSLTAADWPQFLGPDRNGVSPEKELMTDWPDAGPEKLWEMEAGIGVSSFAVVDGVAFTTGNKRNENIIYAVNAETGEELWTYKYDVPFEKRMFDGGTAGTPTVSDGMVYSVSHLGHVLCLDAKTGKKVWEKHLVNDFNGKRPRWGYSQSALVIGSGLILETGGKGSSLVALRKDSGELIWESGNHEAAYSSPIIYQHGSTQAVLTFNSHGLVAHDARSGKQLWDYRWKTSYDVNAVTPVITERGIFISSGYGTGSGLIKASGSSARSEWKTKDFQNQMTNSVVVGDHIYGFHCHHVGRQNELHFACVDLRSGDIEWTEYSTGLGSLILVDDTLVIQTEKGELILAEPSSNGYKELQRIQVLGGRSWITPAYSNGVLFMKNNQGKAVAYRLGPKAG